MMELIFLGSGGGRFITITQKRSTGGFILKDDVKIHVDPGPGALVKSWEHNEDPRKLDALVVSHCHIDHYNDCGVLIDAMTNGVTKKKGMLIGSGSVIDGIGFHLQSKNYSEGYLERIETLKSGDSTKVGNVKIIATPTIHSDPTTIGFKFITSEGNISYISDTQYFPDLSKWHKDARILIICITRPSHNRVPYHLNTTDAIKLAKDIHPELIVMTHIGMKMHMDGAETERKEIEDKTNIKTIIAKEGEKLIINALSITTSL